jgi:hypothetical protein
MWFGVPRASRPCLLPRHGWDARGTKCGRDSGVVVNCQLPTVNCKLLGSAGASGYSLSIIRLTNQGTYGSLYLWSFYGQIVVGGSPRRARRGVWLESHGTRPNLEMEIEQEIYERSHYVIDNTGSRFENELKTNSK